jgi:outer membrane protein
MLRPKDKSQLTLLAVAGALFYLVGVAAPGAAYADSKPIGVIDTDRIANEYDLARDAKEQIQKFIRDLELEISEKERQLQRLAEELESQQMLLGEEALAAKRQEFENLRTEYFQFREQVEGRAEQEYTEKMGPIIDQVRTIAERLGKEEGFGLIIDSTALAVLYVDDSVDLTNEVLAALVRGGDD